MRIISGIAKGRLLRVPKSVSRPSTDRLREALFSVLGIHIKEARVLDLFAGSGALGIEALSRGARVAEFVDSSRESHQVIQRNLKDLQFANGKVHSSDVFNFLKKNRASFDVVFADPPYKKNSADTDYVSQLLATESLIQSIESSGYLIIEDSATNEPRESSDWILKEDRSYGGCRILIYQKKLLS